MDRIFGPIIEHEETKMESKLQSNSFTVDQFREILLEYTLPLHIVERIAIDYHVE